MCGIFGVVSNNSFNKNDIKALAKFSLQRGKDSSGIIYSDNENLNILRSDKSIKNLMRNFKIPDANIFLGHSRLITNGFSENQPVVREDLIVIHNGIIHNHRQIWEEIELSPKYMIDSEILLGVALNGLKNKYKISEICKEILSLCEGTISCALIFAKLGKICLISNNGSLYVGYKKNDLYFYSEKYPLTKLALKNIHQIKNGYLVIDIPSFSNIKQKDVLPKRKQNIIPSFKNILSEEKLLKYKENKIRRCYKCILPETMPFIKFDNKGICNYCNNYVLRNVPKPLDEIFNLVEPYRKEKGPECIVPFSGGRDSCVSLHLIVKELKIRPIAYTYDWGMVTDLGRRNISRMCSDLNVENIIVAADIEKKRRNIQINLKAWLKSPHLGMISILTAGDKHFFRHLETIKKQNDIKLNLWGINPLEVTHFKAGFLGVKPSFEEDKVYISSIRKQLNYQWLRLNAMKKSPLYFNKSIFDTLLGEYFRSFHKKKDYFHIYDYWRWEEALNDEILDFYNWEKAPDTNTTWRIGDGTAAFYNYIYYSVAGFTEHDTFRSNQIREGQISRQEALEKVIDENKPRYQNIRWYLDVLNMDYEETISCINNIKSMF